MEPRFNEALYNEVLVITNDILLAIGTSLNENQGSTVEHKTAVLHVVLRGTIVSDTVKL